MEVPRNPFKLLGMAEIKPLSAIKEKWTRVTPGFSCAWFTIVARTLRKVMMNYLPAKVKRSIKRPLRF